MAQVDQVTQRNASAAEELSSTAEEMSAQAEALQQLMAFFRVKAQEGSASKRAFPSAIQAPNARPPAARAVRAPRPGGDAQRQAASDREFRRF